MPTSSQTSLQIETNIENIKKEFYFQAGEKKLDDTNKIRNKTKNLSHLKINILLCSA